MTDRFPATVADALRAAGWQPGTRDHERAQLWALSLSAYAAPDGRHHMVVPAAIEAWAEFGGLSVPAQPDGEQIASSAFAIDPTLALHSVATLAALAGAIGTPLTPLGEEGDGTGILAVDAHGRVFVCDHGGDWLLGDTVDEALTALVLGFTARRVAEDGTW
ncbi:SUKH-3 domain-containing protein [Krasilnikovia sp. MM14-A1259]|uniref:SUKH-3 domain-containing protein n=1 Tax=Krasilnikovia sp. MM14-A1259 TaxID=3373539 RepID=UPI00381ADCB9